MTAARWPLVSAADDIVAYRSGRAIRRRELLAAVHGLAALLPPTGPAINTCSNRYHFLVGFTAALVRGITTLLAPNSLPVTLNALHRESPGSFLLGDAAAPEATAPLIRVDEAPLGREDALNIAPDLLAAIAYTSGSTGAGLPQRKTWSMLAAATAINLPYYLPAGGSRPNVVATVPAQHMYGLETTVLPVLLGAISIHDGRPFHPADVVAALESLPAPRMLVSTPIHLRALVACELGMPPLARVLCATAPLDSALAACVEKRFATEVVEIYGCTEVGSMAWRRPAAAGDWQFFDGLLPATRDDATWISAAHLPSSTRLPDRLEFRADGSFVLAGRDSDLVKIGGKRSSLAEITRALLSTPGVVDAAVFPLSTVNSDGRLAALVVAPHLDPESIRARLRALIDDVFIPRPIVLADALPRTAAGKLPREAALDLYTRLTRPGAAVQR